MALRVSMAGRWRLLHRKSLPKSFLSSSAATSKSTSSPCVVVQTWRHGDTERTTRLRARREPPQSTEPQLGHKSKETNESKERNNLEEPLVETRSARSGVALAGGRRRLLAAAADALAAVFLPKNLAAAVTRDYVPYSLWAFANAVTGTVTGTLATQALLQALGLGAGAAIGLAATTNWIVKDGFGLLGGVLFAGCMGNRFDASPKYYRFLASVCIQLANLVELATPAAPHLFVLLASLSNISKNIGWLAASATRASLHRSFARRDNLGDITAKAGAQSTAAGLVGTGGGILLSYLVGAEPASLLAAFLPLSALNVYATFKSNRAVVTRNMNIERAEICLDTVIESNATLFPSPDAISHRETMFGPSSKPFKIPLTLETPINQSELVGASLPTLQAFARGQIVNMPGLSCFGDYRLHVSSDSTQLSLWFLENASTRDITIGFVHACILRRALDPSKPPLAKPLPDWRPQDIVDQLSAAGWDIKHTHLGDINRRISFEALDASL